MAGATPTGQMGRSRYTRLTGASGEFYVAAELTRRLWMASVTPQGVERTDVLAQHLETRRVIAVQVKTAGPGNHFRANKKLEEPTRADNEWLALVNLRDELERPDLYIVPRNVIAALIWVEHRLWLLEPGRSGRPHKDSDQRNIQPKAVTAYKDRWDLLETSAHAVGYMLPDWFFEGVESVGLPEEHPGVVRTQEN